jgi:hypothetical protein
MLGITVEGHCVTCTQNMLGHRVWHCDCREYDRRLLRYGEGFCAHLVVVIQGLIEDDSPLVLGRGEPRR